MNVGQMPERSKGLSSSLNAKARGFKSHSDHNFESQDRLYIVFLRLTRKHNVTKTTKKSYNHDYYR